MKLFLAIFITLFSQLTLANPNFECSIYDPMSGENLTGTLTLSGDQNDVQDYKIILKTSPKDSGDKEFTGKLYLNNMISFTDLPTEIQNEINQALKMSKRPNLSAGPLVLFTNTQNPSDSTLTVSLMPSGEIAYIQLGFIELFCM